MSYFLLYPEWNWIVARGVYFDVLDKIIEEKKELVVRTMKKEQILLFSFVCLSIASVIVVAHFFTLGINGIIEQYKEKQKEHLEDLARMNRILEKKATTDTLTGLYNRFYFNTKLEDELTRYKRYKSPFCLIVFDVDDFKMINDTLGHVSGDYVLREIAVLVAYEIRQSDIFARWGGEEFVILTVENDLKATVKLAEKLRRSIEKHSFSIDMNVTCSFGVTEYMADEGAKELIDRTDQALYAAKRDGKNKVKTA